MTMLPNLELSLRILTEEEMMNLNILIAEDLAIYIGTHEGG